MSNLERVVFIHRHVQDHGSISLSAILEEFGISRRQAARDMDYLRYSCGAPLEYDPSMRAYQ